MVIGIIGESCTGKSTLALLLSQRIECEVITGKDYLRLAKNENIAKALFQKKLQAALREGNIIYVISEKEHLALLPEGALRILVMADLQVIKERFAQRMRGNLPAPVAAMLEKKHGCFDNEPRDLLFISGQSDPEELCEAVIRKSKTEGIITYLNGTYSPEGIILYGSYADGTNGPDSDFDCMVICQNPSCMHDTSVVAGVTLDVFVYSPEELSCESDCREFLQIHDGIIIRDASGAAGALLERVQEYVREHASICPADIKENLSWCEKMLSRTLRQDTEGFFLWHWLLCDTLEIYCDICGQFYFGPKKSIRFMKENDTEGYRIYDHALRSLDHDSLQSWIGYLQTLFVKKT